MQAKTDRKLYRVYSRLCYWNDDQGTLTKGRQKVFETYTASELDAFEEFIAMYPLTAKMSHYEIQIVLVDKNAYVGIETA